MIDRRQSNQIILQTLQRLDDRTLAIETRSAERAREGKEWQEKIDAGQLELLKRIDLLEKNQDAAQGALRVVMWLVPIMITAVGVIAAAVSAITAIFVAATRGSP